MSDSQEVLESTLLNLQHNVVGVLISTALLGVYTALLLFSSYVLLYRGLRTQVHSVLFLVNLAMYGLAVGYYALSCKGFLQPIFHLNKYLTTSPEESSKRKAAMILLVGLVCILGDAIALWRTAIIWGPSRTVKIICGTFWLVTFVLGAADYAVNLFPQRQSSAKHQDILPNSVSPIGGVSILTSFLSNILVVVLISIRTFEYWRSQRLLASSAFSAWKLLLLLAEGGVVYCLIWIACVVSYFKASVSTLQAMEGVVVLSAGIYPTLMIAVVSLQTANGTDTIRSPLNQTSYNTWGHGRGADVLQIESTGMRFAERRTHDYRGSETSHCSIVSCPR